MSRLPHQIWSPSRAAIAVLSAWFSFAPALGEELSPSLRDCRWTLQVRQSLLQDERLSDLNLGVTVRDHVAVLWGPVPSAELARLAVERVQQIQGIAAVVNELHVDHSLPQWPVKPQQKQSGPSTKSAIAGGALMGRPPEHRPASGQGMGWRPVKTPADDRGTSSLPHAANPSQPALVLPAIAVPLPPAPTSPRPAATLLQPIFPNDGKRPDR